MSLTKILKKALTISLLTVSSFVILGSVFLYFYQDEIIQRFISEANKQLKAKVNVEKISTNLFDAFPTISIKFNGVKIESTLIGDNTPFLNVGEISFSLNPLDVINGQYTVEGLTIKNGSCHMYVDKVGNINYDLLQKVNGNSKSQIGFELSKIGLNNIAYTYKSIYSEIIINGTATKANASITAEGDNFYISTNGKFDIDVIQNKEYKFLENKETLLTTDLVYNTTNKSLEIRPSNLNVNNSDFLVYGKYTFIDERLIELYIENKNSTLKSIASILPTHIEDQLKKYNSNGDVYFDMSLIGALDTKNGPELEVKYGLSNAELIYPDKNISVTNANAEGYFKLKTINNLKTGYIEFNNIKGTLEGNSFTGNLVINDLLAPHLNLKFTGLIDSKALADFLDEKSIESVKGSLDVDISFDGKVNDLKKKETSRNIKTSGQLIIKDLTIKSAQFKLPISELNGTLLFDNNDVAIDRTEGIYGSSHFKLDGYIKNLFGYLLLPNEVIGIDAELTSRQIDLNELLSSQNKEASNYSFFISPKLILRFKCNIEELVFRRFHPTDISGTVLIKNKVLTGENIAFKSIGGNVLLNGIVDSENSNKIKCESKVQLENILLDSAFYIFENFRQDFISDIHLKGNIDADFNASMTFDSLLNVDPSSIESTISTTIKNGQLNNFDPLQQLDKYIDDYTLKNLRFSDIETDLVIKNQTVYLPQIDIESNATSLKLSGTHTFDQRIDYRVITPLNRNKKIDKDAAFGAIEEVEGGKTLLFLKITGTTSNYEVSYDKQAVKNKIASDLKKEVNELKEAFKNKGLKEDKKVELEEDDYFEWD